jgi:hypothetical protein
MKMINVTPQILKFRDFLIHSWPDQAEVLSNTLTSFIIMWQAFLLKLNIRCLVMHIIKILLVLAAYLVSGCSHYQSDDQITDVQAEYTLVVPSGWHELVKEKDVMKHVFWGFSNSNYTKHKEEPIFRAWVAPEKENAFFTIMEVKRHCNLGVGVTYNEIHRIFLEDGWKIQETGSTRINDRYCKWWIQTHANGALQQQCYLVANGPYFYAIAFTTSHLSEDKQKQFDQIAHSIAFHKGL